MGSLVSRGWILLDACLFPGGPHLLLRGLPADSPRGLLRCPAAGVLCPVSVVSGHRLPGDGGRGGFRYLEVQENVRLRESQNDKTLA